MKWSMLSGLVLFSAAITGISQTVTNGRQWNVTVVAVNEQSEPVSNVAVKVWFHIAPKDGQTIAMTNRSGLTDASGIFIASGNATSAELGIEAQIPGYYTGGTNYELGLPYQYDRLKWNPLITVLLRTVGNPVPMYAKRVMAEPPILNQAVGFDLMEGDWVAPNGKGRISDFIFTKAMSVRSAIDYESTLKLSFSNSGDGIQLYEGPDLQKTSSFRSPRTAPLEGYRPELVRQIVGRPGLAKFEFDPKRIYLFRVRTDLDKTGVLKSALYGKIYGDFMQFQYYLNPIPNDRNIEFNPAQNLLTNMTGAARIQAP